MRKIMFYLFTVAIVFGVSSKALAINVNDGIFTEAEWAGSYEKEVWIGGGGFVGPGWGGEDFNVKYIGLKPEGDRLYFALVTGFNLVNGVTYDGIHYDPGDFALSVNGDGPDFAIQFNIAGDDPQYSLYKDVEWESVMYRSHEAECDPFRMSSGTGTPLSNDSFEGKFFMDGTDYVLEGSFSLAALGLLAPIESVKLSWTMECGNDCLNITRPVPEPSTLLLLGSGLVALGLLGRKKKRIKG